MQALDDLTVLDLTHHIPGPFATKMLADYGANVIKVEKPGGDVTRSFPPFQGDEVHLEKSGTFLFLNTNKRSVQLDLKTEHGKEALAVLARKADIIVESFRPGVLDRLGVGWEFLQSVNPAAPLVSISNFGQTGPYRDYRLSEITLYGFAGEMYSLGLTEREPVKIGGTAALVQSGAAITPAVMAALFASGASGKGQHVDIALAETHFGGCDRRHATAIGYQFSGRRTLRAAGSAQGTPSGIYPCADGWVDFSAAQQYPDRVARMLGNPDWLSLPEFENLEETRDPAMIELWNAYFMSWCMERTKKEIWEEARRERVMCGPLNNMADLAHDEHFAERGFWQETEHPVMGNVTVPGRPFLMEEGGWELRRTAPLLGEHTREVLEEAGVDQATISVVLEGLEQQHERS